MAWETEGKLLDARASTDLANDAGNCPLHWVRAKDHRRTAWCLAKCACASAGLQASLNGHVEVVKMLIAARANANLKNDFQKRRGLDPVL